MRTLLCAAFLAASLFLSPASASAAAGPVVPSWMKIQQAARLVHLDITAGWNANNGALNFNGYFSGGMTVVVPVGWTVDIAFKNTDAMLPHSLLVTRAYGPTEMPDIAGANQVAISRAYTNNPEEGLPSQKTDDVRFVVKEAGDFYFFCGAPGHGHGGMWTKLKVEAGIDTPSVVIDPGTEEGRK
jgi:hypothetical protein